MLVVCSELHYDQVQGCPVLVLESPYHYLTDGNNNNNW